MRQATSEPTFHPAGSALFHVAAAFSAEGDAGWRDLGRALVRSGTRRVFGWVLTLRGQLAAESPLGSLVLRVGYAQAVRAGSLPLILRHGRPSQWAGLVLLLEGGLAWRYWHYLVRRHGTTVRCGDTLPVRRLRTLALWRGDGARRAAIEVSRRVHQWLCGWHEFLEASRPPVRVLPRLDSRDLLLEAFANRTVKDLAAALGLSRSYASRQLAQRWGRTPARVLREVRLRAAAAALRETPSRPIAAIASNAGYRSTTAFLAAFKRQFGTTPARIRERGSPVAPPPRRGRTRLPVVLPADTNPLQDDRSREHWDLPIFRLSVKETDFAPHRHTMDLSLSAVLRRPCAVLTLAGAAWFETRSGRALASPGSLVFYRQPAHARWLPVPAVQRWRRIWVHFQGDLASAVYDALTSRYGWWLTLPLTSPPARQLRRLARAAHSRRRAGPLGASQAVYQWMMSLIALLERSGASRRRKPDVEGLASRHFENQPLRLVDYARHLGYSRAHIARKLKQHWGITPGRRLRDARLELAAGLLRTEETPVRSVARRSGYRSASSFTRAFRKRFGQNPRVYRREHRAG